MPTYHINVDPMAPGVYVYLEDGLEGPVEERGIVNLRIW